MATLFLENGLVAKDFFKIVGFSKAEVQIKQVKQQGYYVSAVTKEIINDEEVEQEIVLASISEGKQVVRLFKKVDGILDVMRKNNSFNAKVVFLKDEIVADKRKESAPVVATQPQAKAKEEKK